jgi:hypothetical protein
MDHRKLLYTEQAANTSECFEGKLAEIKLKHKDYFELNEIDLDDVIVPSYDNYHIKYFLQKSLSPEIEKEIELAFQECLAKFQS